LLPLDQAELIEAVLWVFFNISQNTGYPIKAAQGCDAHLNGFTIGKGIRRGVEDQVAMCLKFAQQLQRLAIMGAHR